MAHVLQSDIACLSDIYESRASPTKTLVPEDVLYPSDLVAYNGTLPDGDGNIQVPSTAVALPTCTQGFKMLQTLLPMLTTPQQMPVSKLQRHTLKT